MTMILDGSNGLTMPTWTTANRPTNPIIGAQGYNTTYGGVEVYNGSAWDLITGGPAFSAYPNGTASIATATVQKVACNTKDFDTNNCFDASTNYRFTPTVAGYYQISGSIGFYGFSSGATTGQCVSYIYKNGSTYCQGARIPIGGNSTEPQCPVSAVVYLNGSTDYVELWAYQTSGAGATLDVGRTYSYFTGAFIRGQ